MIPREGSEKKSPSSQPIRSRAHPPSAHVIDPAKKQVIVKFGKSLSIAAIESYARLLIANPSFQPSFAEIVDLRAVEQVDLEADDFFKLADVVDPFSPQARRAFVVRNSVQNHAARMHKILCSQSNIEIFRSLEDAERWIHS